MGKQVERLQWRFLEAYHELRTWPRQRRRFLQGKLSRTRVGAAVLALNGLDGPAAFVAEIAIDTTVSGITADGAYPLAGPSSTPTHMPCFARNLPRVAEAEA